MATAMVKTRYQGIWKRGERYVVRYRAGGKYRAETVTTLDEARRRKRGREAQRDNNEFQPQSRLTFREYAEEWIGRYNGKGQRGFKESTRAEYKRDLERYAFPYFDKVVSAITPRDVANWIAWLCDQPNGRGGKLTDRSVRRILAPLRACLGTAKFENVIRHNPADGVSLPNRPTLEAPGEEVETVRVLTRQQLDAFMRVVHPEHRLFFRLLVSTGLRWSEAIELHWGDLRLDGSAPCVRVRRALVKGVVGPPKSRHGRRDLALSPGLVSELRARQGAGDERVFTTMRGGPLDYKSMLRRVLMPAAEEADAGWARFHTFRHTFASLHISRGSTVVQLSRAMGHHSPEFTLRIYAHLIPGDELGALDLASELRTTESECNVSAHQRELAGTRRDHAHAA